MALRGADAQKEFYQKLLWNELFVMTTEQQLDEGNAQQDSENTTVEAVTSEDGKILIFTCREQDL